MCNFVLRCSPTFWTKWWAVTFTPYYAPWRHLQRRWLNPLYLTRHLLRYWEYEVLYIGSRICNWQDPYSTVVPTKKVISYRPGQQRGHTEWLFVLLTCPHMDMASMGEFRPRLSYISEATAKSNTNFLTRNKVCVRTVAYVNSQSQLFIAVVTKAFVLLSKYYVVDASYPIWFLQRL